jgi:Recombinase zinc beta ribbon domain
VQRWNLPEGWVISKHPAHAALVSDADFIAAQDTAAPRGPAGPAVRRYLLAGMLACGRCGRRLESAWSNGKPAYRCRHGHTSAASSHPTRAKNTYVREDQILLHLAAISILLAGVAGEPGCGNWGPAQVTGPARAADLIDHLRADGIVLTYDPQDRTPRAGGGDDVPSVTIGRDHWHSLTPERGKGGPPRDKRGKSTCRGRRLSAGDGPSMPVNGRSWGFNVSEDLNTATGEISVSWSPGWLWMTSQVLAGTRSGPQR